MKKKLLLTLVLVFASLFTTQVAMAEDVLTSAPEATPAEAIEGLLTRIGGASAPGLFEIVIDATLDDDTNGKDVFVITAQNGKPCIKGNNQLSVATGINWYLNHYAHINLTWNNLTTDLSLVTLPVPGSEEKHVCNTTYRYDFNTCTFSYSMAFWTWDRWQKEIDWMALHGINAPLNLVGLDVVTRNFLKELGMSDSDIAAYIAGPGFIAWFAMNNLEGWGGTINSPTTGVDMSGNPEWWYTRQEQLSKKMLKRMRELGMQPVIPGFSGQIPNSLSNYSITGFSSGDVINGGTWAGGYTRPDILHPNSSSYATLAPIYYKHLEAIMGVSEFYSMDPFHEGGLPDAVTNATCYPPIMAALDTYHNAVEDATKTSYNVSTEDNQAKWIIQYWQNIPQSGAFSSMESYGDRFIGLDLFSDNIYAGNAAKWRDTGNNCYYKGRPYIYCMLHNFGGRSGLHGRLETTMDGYFQALANNNNCQGIGATPEGTETNPILYDMLFELPWMDPANRPTADEWLKDYAYARYGVENATALAALQNLKESVWNCEVNQQGTSEAVILARPNWTVNNVSSWSTSAIYWDTQDVRLAADQLISVADLVTANGGKSGIANYNYDAIDVIRQAMVDFAAELLPLINAARGNDAEYTRLYNLYLQLMLDLDEMLSYDENFKLERWTSLARNIADEVTGTTENDRNWLEWNARTQVTVWSKGNTDLHDYSNRCWAGLIKDFHYERWKYFFENNGGTPNGGWFSGFEYPWTVDFNDVYDYAGDYSQIVIPTDMSATEKAAETFGKYFGRVKGATSNYIFPMGVETNATKSDAIPEVYRGQTVELPLVIGKEVTVSSVQIDLNGDGAISNTEALTADGMNVTIPDDAAIGKTKAIVEFSDGTVITFNLAIIVDITADRTVTAATADANMGTVAIEGTNELTITNMEAVKITATANTGYNFENWTDAQDNVVSNDNPYIYYGEGDASFTANFIQDKWGVPAQTANGLSDATTNNQYVNNISLAYYKREAESIYSVATNGIPTSLFTTVPQIIDVPQGASFTISWSDNGAQNLTKCFMSAYMDFNANGDFSEEGELVKVVGTRNDDNSAVRSGSMEILLPYDAPLGITHLRMRFDSAWGSEYNSETGAFNPKGQLDRMCYEIVLNITDKTDKAAHVTVKTNSEEWGTVEVWTDETPDGSTGTEWDVSSNIPLYLRATKSTPDTEFLGWYDHYGRLLTTELEYTMYAREDATYTAKFRKFLEIDGWQMEYRTEPGAMKTNKLANGVKPENGKTYYIYAPTRPTNDGDYVNRYLYNNNGTLSLNTTASDDNYLWTCSVDGENYTFQNVGDPAKYLAHKATAASPYNFKLGTGATQYEGITIYLVNDSRFLVTKDDGTGFDQSNRAHNQSTEDYTTDYVFTEVSYPDNVILTNVRQSGNHDLVIPETVEILGEQCTITGFDNGLFTNNKDLWSISLPATIETMSNNRVFKAAVPGKGANQSADASNYIVTDLGTTCAPGEDWAISLTIEDNGNNFNQWGSALIATGNAPMNSTYANGFQLYMQSTSNGGKLIVKLDNDNNNNALASISKGTMYRIDIVYTHSNTQLVVTATSLESQASLAARRANATRATNSLTLTQDMSGFSTVSHAIPEGVNITNLEVTKGAVPDPFEGCTNLMEMTVAAENENYYVADRTLYTTGGTDLHELVEEEKAEKFRELATLIEQMQELTAKVGTFNPTGKETKILLQTTEGNDYYIWCSNPHTSGNDGKGGVAALLDDDASTYLHSNWDSNTKSSTHDYLQVNFGSAAGLNNFKIAGQQRSGAQNDFPKNIEIYGSNDNSTWTPIDTVKDLPNTVGATWSSTEVISSYVKYSYLKFVVKTHDNYNKTNPLDRPYFHMAKFDLYEVSASADVFDVYAGTELTDDFAAARYDVLLNAIEVHENGTTVVEMEEALAALQQAYDDLLEKFNNALPFTLTTNEENPVLYNIYHKRTGNLMTYNYANDKVDIAAKSDNNSFQAWYFMLVDNSLKIYPYNGNGKLLGANDTNNGNDKLLLATSATYQSWTVPYVKEDGGNKYYFIKTNGTFVNDHSNKTDSIGFWNGANASTDGSLFRFVEAEFDNDNPRYYQMKDIYELMPVDGTNVYGGTSVGLYTNGEEYGATYRTAKSLVDAGNTSNATDCYAAYKALCEVIDDNPTYNAPDPDKAYYIISAATNANCAYCAGKYMYSPNQSLTRARGSYTGTHNHNNLIFDSFADISPKQVAAFRFVETGVQGEYKIKSVNSDLYVKSFTGTHMGTEAEAATVKIAGYANGQVTLTIGNNSPMHAQNDFGVIVQWRAEAGNASLWRIDEVTDVTAFNHTLTVPESGIAALYLPFNVILPEGVTAYTVAADDILTNLDGSYYYELTQVAAAGEKLAKGTAVIIKAAAGEYTFEATLDDAVSPASSALAGTYYAINVNSDETTKRYSIAVEEEELVFNAITADTAVEPYSCWLVADGITTDKIGLKQEIQPVEILDGAIYRIKGRLSDGTLRTLYTNGSNNRILWTTDEEKTDATTLFIAQKNEETGKYRLVSALANGIWSQDATLSEKGVELTLLNGSANGTVMILGDGKRRFCVDSDNLDYFSNVGDAPAGDYVNENVTTDFVLELVEDATVSYTVKMGKSYAYATLYLPFAVTVPDGVTAYVANTPTSSLIQLMDLQGIIPAYTPVVLYRESTTATEEYEFVYTTDAPNVDLTGVNNILTGYLIETLVEGATGYRYYMLMMYNTFEKFYWILKEYDSTGKLWTNVTTSNEKTHIKCSANKAFLAMSELQASSSYSFQLPGTTDIEEIVPDGGESDAIYDLHGRKIIEPVKGSIYIKNGKVFIAK